MSAGYNLSEAVRMEVESLPFVSDALNLTVKVDDYKLPGHDSQAGKVLGESLRKIARFIQSLPGMTMMLDTVTRSYSLDLLLSDLKQDPHNPLLLVHTAEAQQRVTQLYRIIRVARAIEPVSSSTSEILRKAATIDVHREPSVLRLAKAAHGLVLKGAQAGFTFEDRLALARVHRLYRQPGKAISHGLAAAKIADVELKVANYSAANPSFMDRCIQKGDRLGYRTEARLTGYLEDKEYDGCPSGADPELRWQLRKGAALMTVALAFYDAGKPEKAAELAQKASSATDFTCAKEVMAKLRKPGKLFIDGVMERSERMDGIRALDRIYYYGHWNGSIRIVGGVIDKQFDKLGRWLS